MSDKLTIKSTTSDGKEHTISAEFENTLDVSSESKPVTDNLIGTDAIIGKTVTNFFTTIVGKSAYSEYIELNPLVSTEYLSELFALFKTDNSGFNTNANLRVYYYDANKNELTWYALGTISYEPLLTRKAKYIRIFIKDNVVAQNYPNAKISEISVRSVTDNLIGTDAIIGKTVTNFFTTIVGKSAYSEYIELNPLVSTEYLSELFALFKTDNSGFNTNANLRVYYYDANKNELTWYALGTISYEPLLTRKAKYIRIFIKDNVVAQNYPNAKISKISVRSVRKAEA